MNIWQQLQKPIYMLAPMEDVTDTVFRQIISTVAKPALYFTEFTNVDGFFSPGHKYISQRLQFDISEKPIIAQIWGLKPENYFLAAKKLVEMGFDGIDINMGCPQKNVIQHGACSALINNHSLAKEIIDATKEGANSTNSGQVGVPISVKTRLGFKTLQTEEWIGFLLKQDLAALTVHGRTAAEMSAVPAHWDEIGKVVEMRDQTQPVIASSAKQSSFQNVIPDPLGLSEASSEPRFHEDKSIKIGNGSRIKLGMTSNKTLIIGNGDVMSLQEAQEKVEKYGLDGVMIGRGIFHNPWMFGENVDISLVTIKQRLDLLLKHVDLFENTWGDDKSFQVLKKYFKIYVQGFAGASELRTKLMECNTKEEVEKIIAGIYTNRSRIGVRDDKVTV